VLGARRDDNAAIVELLQGWMYRDLAQWDHLRGIFHPGATIEVTWFEGPFEDFIAGSMRMHGSDFRSKHLIGTPVIDFSGDRSLAETNVVIVAESNTLKLGCSVHARFLDRVERRQQGWGILRRACVYDFGSFTFPFGPAPIDQGRAQSYPCEYAALAYLLEQGGFSLKRVFPTRGSEQERVIRASDRVWLESNPA
jgi:hypothetical protein